MNFLEKIDMLMARNGDTVASLSRNAGIPYTTIDGLYKKGYTNTKLSTLLKLCDYFGVTLDYLVKESELAEMSLTAEEQQLVTLYRNATDAAREIAVETLQHHQKSAASDETAT